MDAKSAPWALEKLRQDLRLGLISQQQADELSHRLAPRNMTAQQLTAMRAALQIDLPPSILAMAVYHGHTYFSKPADTTDFEYSSPEADSPIIVPGKVEGQ